MALGILMGPNPRRHKILRLERAVRHHREHIDHIMRQTVHSIEHVLPVIVHFELATGHLRNAVVDCFVGIDGCFQISVF